MKKLVSLLLVGVMLFSLGMFYTSALSPLPPAYFKDKFIEKYGNPQFYEELKWHFSDENKTVIDWAIVNVATEIMVEPIENPVPKYYYIGDIVYSTIYYHQPFVVPYCIYDVAKDEFICVCDVDFDEYEGLSEFFDSRYGRLSGDADEDSELSILDATEIQRIEAQLVEVRVPSAVLDFNRDKSVNVMDATAIQMKLVQVSE